ncbi:MAG: LysM peptidoglycan-binding domain-containing protein [Pseudomonadota bacterium]
MKSGRWIVSVLFLAVLTVGQAAAKDTAFVELTVVNGDTLYNICAEYLENQGRWTDVARFNHLRNADLIYPGQTLKIPVDLMKGFPLNGVVSFVSGAPRVSTAGGGQWKPLALNDTLSQGDLIQTGDDGNVEVTYSSGVSFLIRPGTFMAIGTASQQGDSRQSFNLLLTIGRAISLIRKITGQECRFEIQTPSAIAGARGTRFRVSVDDTQNTRCEVQEGTVVMGGTGKSQVMVNPGEGILVSSSGKLNQPSLLPPPPEVLDMKELYRSLPIELSLESVSNASNYRVVLSRDDTFRALLLDRRVSGGNPVSIALLEDGTYYLKTSSIDARGLEGDFSRAVPISVRVNPLPPFILNPADNDQYRETPVALEWLSVQDASGYQVQVARDREFTSPVLDRDDLGTTALQSPSLEIGTWYFRVRSAASDGFKGLWSDIISFEVVPLPPSPPVEKTEVDKTQIRLRWKNLGEKLSYHLQMADNPVFETLLVDKRIDRPEMSIEKPDKAGTYYFRISGIDEDGYEGSFSPPQSLEIKSSIPWPAMGTLISFLLAVIAL